MRTIANICPDTSAPPGSLAKSGHHLLLTSFGPLDVLGSIGEDDDYPTLVSRSQGVQLDRDVSVRILDLDPLIEVK